MELDYCPDLRMDTEYYPTYKPNGNIESIIKGTEKALLDKRNDKIGELSESLEQKNISLDAIRRIGEIIFSDNKFKSIFLLLSLEIQARTDISEEAKEVLINNEKLIFSLSNVIENIVKLENYDFKIRNIDIGKDPQIPEWKPLLINLEIKSDSFEERLRIKHEIIKIAYKNLDGESRKNIYLIGAI